MYNVSFICCFAVRLLRKKGKLGGETLLMADCKRQKAPNREPVLIVFQRNVSLLSRNASAFLVYSGTSLFNSRLNNIKHSL